MNKTGITVYGCERDEAHMFRTVSPRFGVVPMIVRGALSEANAALTSGNRCVSVGHKSRVSEPLIRLLKSAGVKYISTRSVGCDHIDTRAAGRMGIAVEGVAYSPGSVADHTLMLILLAVRDAKAIVSAAERHDFRLRRARGKELCDLTVGVVGAGRIGAAVAARLRGFGCRVLACGRGREAAAAAYVPLDELLRKSDVVTLHLPLNADTRHIIGRAQLQIMRRGAFLVNTGRGALIDTAALVQALESGALGGAALDVLEGEEGLFYCDRTQTPIDNPFFLRLQRMPNVVITPHTAYYTERALRDTVENTITNCLAFERGRAYG